MVGNSEKLTNLVKWIINKITITIMVRNSETLIIPDPIIESIKNEVSVFV